MRAKREIKGLKKVMVKAPIRPPQKDANNAIERALPASPRCPMGYPSRMVAAAAGVPGVLISIAAMEPPYIAPQKMPRSKPAEGIIDMP